MQLSRVADAQTPFIMNVPVFGASTIAEGAAMISGASTTAQGVTVTAALDTTLGVNFIGVTQVGSLMASTSKENKGPNSHAFNLPTSGACANGTLLGLNYLPLVINTDASYFAFYSVTTGAASATDTIDGFTAALTTDVERGTTGTDVLGGWLYSLAGANSAGGTPTYSGSLRYISNQSATTSVTLLTAMKVSTDSHMVWVDRTWKKAGILDSTAVKLRSTSGSTGTGFKLTGTKMLSIENYIVGDHAPLHPLREWVDDGLDGLTGVKLYGELRFTSPFLGNG